ncbi:MAG: dihydrofolate reductase [Lachnospiraceae bacterium]|nr:dihydrofolate reductase [Lachnospiraceae bacterium]
MRLIAAVDKNWGIGYKNELLVRIPMDQKQFQALTMGRVIIMGRKTFESLPGGVALRGRKNVVLTRDENFKAKDAYVVHSVDECLELIKTFKEKGYREDDIYVIGGQRIYEQFLPMCDTAIITEINYEYAADAYLDDLSKSPDWVMTDESDEMTYFDLEFYFRKYERR